MTTILMGLVFDMAVWGRGVWIVGQSDVRRIGVQGNERHRQGLGMFSDKSQDSGAHVRSRASRPPGKQKMKEGPESSKASEIIWKTLSNR